MRTTITIGVNDKIEAAADWGFSDGIQISNRDGETVLYVLTAKQISDLRWVLTKIEQGQAERAAMYDRAPEPDWDSGTGPEMAGFEDEVA